MSNNENNNDTNGDIHTPSPNIEEVNAYSDNNNSVTADLSSNNTLNISTSNNVVRKLTKNGILIEL